MGKIGNFIGKKQPKYLPNPFVFFIFAHVKPISTYYMDDYHAESNSI